MSIRIYINNSIRKIFEYFPAKNCILFESVPDLSDNTKQVFDEMIRRNINKKYRLIWLVEGNPKDYPRIKNVKYITTKSRVRRFIFEWVRLRSKCLISCNGFLKSEHSRQKSFFLCHGTGIKSVHGYYNVPKKIDYVLVDGNGTREMMAYELNFDINRTIALGFPRNDVLTNKSVDSLSYFKGDFKKMIIWYPTFRQQKNGYHTNERNALPVLHDLDQAIVLNEVAKRHNVLIVVKPHFAQDISYIKDYGLGNIIFINDNFFKENKISSYEFIAGCDAMITDYSSIYFDYLLCNKPMAVVWEDIEEYRKKPGFAIDVDYYLKGAEKIYNLDDFKIFIEHVATGNDELKNERKEISNWANYSDDGKNASRVVDFIIERAKL